MARNKDLKRLVRARMSKTGESYTAARAQITRRTPKDLGKIAGMSDDAVRAKTQRGWTQWVAALDAEGAATMSHRDIARILSTRFGIGSWWAQMVTVGYERIKGLRTRGQGRDGSFEATKSKTFNVPVETLFDAWHDAKRRAKWLGIKGMRARTSTRPKSIRFDWPDGGIIAVGFFAKGKTKSSVAIAHPGLGDRDSVARIKALWTEQLALLGDYLADSLE